MANEGYKPTGTYNDAALSDADRAKVNAYKQQWETAFNQNDRAGMDAAHAGAEAVRAQYGYSGGHDGSEYHAAPMTQPQYTRATLEQPRSGESYINSLYEAQKEAALAALKSAYDANVLTIEEYREKLAPYYQDARNETAAQSEMNRAAFNELAAAKGLNSGAGGQASLAMGNALQRDISGIARAEADANAELNNQRTRLETAYKNDIAQAVIDGDLAKAQMLYAEYVRVDNAMMSTSQAQANEDYRAWDARTQTYNTNTNMTLAMAQMLASFGDFSGFLALGYTPEQVDMMRAQSGLLPAYGMQSPSG